MRFRFSLLISLFFFLYGTLVFNLYTVQVQNAEVYSAKAESQLQLSGLLEPVRGNIYFTDKNGSRIPVAINKDFPFIYAVPKEITDAKEASTILSPLLGKPAEALETIFSKIDDPYEPLLIKASENQVAAIKNSALPGVYIENQPARFYPLKDLGSQVVGFVSDHDSEDRRLVGQYGVERFRNSSLFGKPGTILRDVITPSKPGESIELTIDRNIQSRAGDILRNLVSDYRAASGSFIVQDPKTGAILAMGSSPSFDPNNYSTYDIETFLNPTVQSVYEPGSVFKVITMAAGIDSGAITPETTYYDTGEVILNGHTIKNWDLKSNGTMTMTNVLERSVNTGSIFAERKTGHATFISYLELFGFGSISGIDLPGEVSGSLGQLTIADTRDVNFATASFGQGISATPIQLITAFSAVANGGVLMQPYVDAVAKPTAVNRAIDNSTARQVIAMMVSAVDKARVAKIPDFTVAGKTGTAFIPNFGGSGYSDDVINTYIGFAPASNPRFTILIKLDKPYGGPVAGLTVVPAFRELAEFILSYYNVAPDRIEASN